MPTSKTSNKSPLTLDSKILCFDLETNHLHGTPFAIGALVIDGRGKVHATFTARCPMIGEADEWVKANVLPAIKDIQQTHGSYEQMREAFWGWYIKAEADSDYVLVSNGYPVEYGFLLDCQHTNLEERYWQHPFPILDLASMLVVAGKDANKIKKKIRQEVSYVPHNPFDDAKITALAAFEALKSTGAL